MKIVVLAVFLAVSQALSPVPRQTADNTAGGNQNVQNHTKGQQAPTAQPKSFPDAISPKKDGQSSQSPANANTQKTVFVSEPVAVAIAGKDWWDKSYVVFTGLLVGGGVLGVFFAIRTLRGIERQAKANEGTLTEIQAAGVQTANLIALAEKHADAAKKSADALVNSERAWVMADLKWSANVVSDALPTVAYRGDGGRVIDVCLVCKNDGQTPGLITAKRICFRNVRDLPMIPDYSVTPGKEFSDDTLIPISVGGEDKTRWTLECDGPDAAGNTVVAYGFVKYRDVFGNDRETRFAYTLEGSQLRRFASAAHYWGYNTYK